MTVVECDVTFGIYVVTAHISGMMHVFVIYNRLSVGAASFHGSVVVVEKS